MLGDLQMHAPEDDRLLVGIETSDDAAVYDLGCGQYLVTTLDFFTPVVDDPYIFGQIAAANSLSDIYAMGALPKMAMNIVCFPNCLPPQVLRDILRGGYDKIHEAGCLVVGGHTVQDDEPKYGLSVNGFCRPDELLTNKGAKPGDVLILTKPIGIGILNTALKGGIATEEEIHGVIEVMRTLNAFGLEAIRRGGGAHAATDVTGFGLGGHLIEMMEGADLSCTLSKRQLPLLKGAAEYAAMGLVPKGAYDNKKYFQNRYVHADRDVYDDLIFDPETSGGLLISVDPHRAKAIMKALETAPFEARMIGEVHERTETRLTIQK